MIKTSGVYWLVYNEISDKSWESYGVLRDRLTKKHPKYIPDKDLSDILEELVGWGTVDDLSDHLSGLTNKMYRRVGVEKEVKQTLRPMCPTARVS